MECETGPAKDRKPRETWRVRRRIIHATLLFCAGQLSYLTFFGADTRLNETLATGAFALMGSVVGAYVFGAAWEDISAKRTDVYGAGYGSPY